MPLRTTLPLGGATLAGCAALGCMLAVLFAPAANAASTPVELRVIAPSGRTLADHTQYTGTVRVKTDPNADCFGSGTGGSGDRVRVRGATALGAVADGTGIQRRLRPLSVTDAFSFGLGVCAIGGHVAPSSGFWYLKHNHAASMVGGDQLRVKRGDELLWFLDTDFSDAPPAELRLRTPDRTKPGSLNVKVHEFADDGTRTPAAGVEVTGADAPTDADGNTTMELTAPGIAKLRATRDGAIPSATERVCVAQKVRDCPKQAGRKIGGSRKRDRIGGTKGPDRIRSKGGRDRIDARDGVSDRVSCGSGRDKVLADPADRLKRCERVIR